MASGVYLTRASGVFSLSGMIKSKIVDLRKKKHGQIMLI